MANGSIEFHTVVICKRKLSPFYVMWKNEHSEFAICTLNVTATWNLFTLPCRTMCKLQNNDKMLLGSCTFNIKHKVL